MYCRTCNYNLRNLAEHRCPECSRAFDPNDLGSFALHERTLPHWRKWLVGLTISGIGLYLLCIVLCIIMCLVGALDNGRFAKPLTTVFIEAFLSSLGIWVPYMIVLVAIWVVAWIIEAFAFWKVSTHRRVR